MTSTAEHRIPVPVRARGLAAGATRAMAAARGLAARRRGTALAVLGLALVAWPFPTLVPGIDSDWNWVAALSFAAEHGMRFGDQLVWTYGPLGFLDTHGGPVVYYGDTGIVTWLFQGLLQLLLGATFLLALRRSLPAFVAFVVAAVVTTIVPDRELGLGIAWCGLALTRADDAPRDAPASAFPLAIGLLAGVTLLGKLNQGIELTALAAIVLATRPGARRRDVAVFAGALLGVAGAAWVATGQTLADVWPYLRNGEQIVGGYAAAMGRVDAQAQWARWGTALIAALALTLVWRVARDARPRRRWSLLALWALVTWLAWKEGFVRQDSGHMVKFFGDVLVLLAIVPVARPRRSLLLASVGACVVLLAASGAPSSGAPYDLGRALDPIAHAKAAVEQARTLASRMRRGALKARLREAIRAHYAVPAPVLAAIGGRTVAFWPHLEGDLAYAYDVRWRPLPVLEAYSAYTPALDRLGADMLASARAPQRIVRLITPAIDDRVLTFEAPATTLALLCRYRPAAMAGLWQTLARGPDRCGAPRVVSTARAAWGASVSVPKPAAGAALLVRIAGADPRGVERLAALWLRPAQRTIALDGASHRLVAATAPDGLLLSVPPGADYPGPFALAPDPARVAVSRDGGEPGGTLRFTFVEVPIGGGRTAPMRRAARP